MVQSQYSSALTISSQKFCRSTICAEPTYFYQAIQFNVSMNGNYTIGCNSSIDTYGYIYNNSFDPFYPIGNFLAEDDDSGDNNQFLFSIFLQTLTRYILIVTTYDGLDTGPFSIIATGLSSIRFSQINAFSKHSMYFKELICPQKTNFIPFYFYAVETGKIFIFATL
ncbi:unnamed protein product [Rotaria sp. Silwood2]|nr:unnamed protein product [Rotaria sp. Silwood2]